MISCESDQSIEIQVISFTMIAYVAAEQANS